MDLFYLLVIIFGLLIIVILLTIGLINKKRYHRQLFSLIKPCPCRREICCRQGGRENISGIISYSWYDNYQSQLPGLRKNILIVAQHLPDWQVQIYSAPDVPRQIKEELMALGAEVIIIGPDLPKGKEGELWKFFAAENSLPFVSLDIDQDIDHRLRRKIKDWLASDYQFAIFDQDIPFIPLFSGAWGGRDCSFLDISHKINQYDDHWSGFGEAFLAKEIYPLIRKRGYWIDTDLYNRSLLVYGLMYLVVIIIVICMLGALYLTQINNW